MARKKTEDRGEPPAWTKQTVLRLTPTDRDRLAFLAARWGRGEDYPLSLTATVSACIADCYGKEKKSEKNA